ncbi:hypothetical protein TVAG_118270 [Trichomonas vaginalis G3]|uniref:Uncharacterized protein n=1 Tax=Trichomonas vaginalis (strain ATCC PRA-98 / G3) TaxID=412133 RepID=A2EI14_TRIV3|nr:immunoglobulins domain-containing protein [Trichomonas vaginalis G3]EAY07746.1 hypothetical protein TVAG_118270 [Trichomonas vaginalis G3]KAI5552593.1 immunoglobulins domain-containing protein [Trichomonas vaginalis G3]|eukprot:XP_001319969.1 hypothetical protein [Trichomonas vaginalis G3]
MSSTDFFSYIVNTNEQIIEITIKWNNRTILSEKELKLKYNNKKRKNLSWKEYVIENLRAEKASFEYQTTEKLIVTFSVRDMYNSNDYTDVYCYIDEISQYTHGFYPPKDFRLFYDISTLNLGKHYFCVKACKYDNDWDCSYTETLEFSINPPNIPPSLSELKINPDVIRQNSGQDVTLSGTLNAPIGQGNVIIYYYFNYDKTNLYNFTINIQRTSSPINIQINIPSNLPENSNTIYIYAVKDEQTSPTYDLYFQYKYNPPVLYIQAENNSEFKKNDGKTFNIHVTIRDNDCSGSVALLYQIDDFQVIKLNQYTISNNNEITNDFYIYFPQNFPESNSHTITLWAKDEKYKKSSIFKFNFSYVYNSPVLSITTPTNINLYRTTNKTITISGIINDADRAGTIYINYRFDEQDIKTLTNGNINSQGTFSFSEEVNLPTILSEGSHHISVWCYDEKNKQTNTERIVFIYYYNKPELTITSPINEQYWRGNNNSIHVEGKVVDKDGFGIVTIKCFIDDIFIQSNEYQISNVNPQPFTFDLLFPSYLSESTHKLIITAVDDSNKADTKFQLFNYKYNPPVLSISALNNQEYKKNDGRSIFIAGSLRDEDRCGNVTLFYKFDGNYESQSINYPINDTYIHILNIPVQFPLDFPESNSHTITIWATDETNKNSSICKLNFSYQYNSPIFKINNLTHHKFMRLNTIKINITYEHIDKTSLSSLYISYDDEYNISSTQTISTPSNFIEQFDIPNYAKFGTHYLTVYGCDIYNHCNKSNEIYFEVDRYLTTNKIDYKLFRNFKTKPNKYR